jgi:peptidoglycan/xylan/chitin deacetylase (PgdA/CDA1 family)
VDCGPCQETADAYQCVEPNVIALTYDDGPSVVATQTLLNTLDANNIKATFFLVGQNIEASGGGALLQSQVTKKHSTVSHSYTHPSLISLTQAQVYTELTKTETAFSKYTCRRPTIFRPPYGSINAAVRTLASNMGYRAAIWNLDTLDWQYAASNPTKVINDQKSAMDALVPTGILQLQHDITSPAVDVVPAINANILAKGLTTVTIDRCLWGPNFKSHPSWIHMHRLCGTSEAEWPSVPAGTCPVSDWSVWSPCDANCGAGKQTRTRFTIPPGLEKTSAACAGVVLIQQQACTSSTACGGSCTFSAWTNWGACSKSCAGGTQMQTRSLLSGTPSKCGPMVNVQLCNTQSCVGRRALRGTSDYE